MSLRLGQSQTFRTTTDPDFRLPFPQLEPVHTYVMSIETAEELLQNGNVSGARDALQAGIRDDPANADYRVFLFQLLCVTGEWQRALNQLNVAADLDPAALLMAQAYRELISCESFREAVFAGQRVPLIFGEPTAWIAPLVNSLSLIADGRIPDARSMVEQAFEQADARPGQLDGIPFDWLADADMRLGPVVEAMIDGKYYWIPMESVQHIALNEPEDLRDLVWVPAEFTWTNQGKSVGFIPARYPGINPDADAGHAMARKTDWLDLGDGFYVGQGQRMYSSGDTDYPVLQVRDVDFSPD